MNSTLVFSIEEFSTFDGPGIRTTVFLKGCPLRCSWCHNPEGQTFENQILKAQRGCAGCGACIKAGNGCLTAESLPVCPNGLLRWAARPYTPEALVRQLSASFDILRLSGGGITFSGGEPLSHPEFLEKALCLLQGKIHTAVQTCGYCDEAVFGRILSLADYFLFDIKLIDESAHKRYTGLSNKKILLNFRTLCKSGKPFTVRTPLIPGVTDTPENLEAIASLLSDNGIKAIELLPYNTAAGSKYKSVDRTYTPKFDESIPVNPHVEIFTRWGIEAKVL
jgi:pyruvate formate lyase activating enzyme